MCVFADLKILEFGRQSFRETKIIRAPDHNGLGPPNPTKMLAHWPGWTMLKGCIGVIINRGGTWVTIKSMRVSDYKEFPSLHLDSKWLHDVF